MKDTIAQLQYELQALNQRIKRIERQMAEALHDRAEVEGELTECRRIYDESLLTIPVRTGTDA